MTTKCGLGAEIPRLPACLLISLFYCFLITVCCATTIWWKKISLLHSSWTTSSLNVPVADAWIKETQKNALTIELISLKRDIQGRPKQLSRQLFVTTTSILLLTKFQNYFTGSLSSKAGAITSKCAVIGCKLKQNTNEGCNSCASIAGLVLSFIACFILPVMAP